MTRDDLVKHYHTLTAACEAVGIAHQNATHWKNNGYIPLKTQFLFEMESGGVLKAEKPVSVAKSPVVKISNARENVQVFIDRLSSLCRRYGLMITPTDNKEIELIYGKHSHLKKGTYVFTPYENMDESEEFGIINFFARNNDAS